MERYRNPDSDGRFYGLNDMVKADCHDCAGCFQCCQGMGNSIVLDPYDIYQLQGQGGMLLEELLAKGAVALSVYDGMILPHLKMREDNARCPFLSETGRCSIHGFRPGICRLFPLGRDFQGENLEYILLEKACTNRNRSKVKVDKWIGVEPAKRYHAFVKDWHDFRRQMGRIILDADAEQGQELAMRIVHSFYLTVYDKEQEFYPKYDAIASRYRQIFEGM